jgi:ribulose-phosphate 3-epimerase
MPSILSADFAKLGEEVSQFNDVIERIHLDVMDGHFVNNLTFGPPIVESIRGLSNLFFDAHLMVTKPEELFEDFVKAGADSITFHIEIGNTKKRIQAVKDLGVKVGLSLNPATPVEDILPFLNDIDSVLVMSVVPGWGGQSFISEVLSKVKQIKEANDGIQVTIDGGINEETIAIAASSGVDYFVAGSAIYKSENPVEQAIRFQGIVDKARG